MARTQRGRSWPRRAAATQERRRLGASRWRRSSRQRNRPSVAASGASAHLRAGYLVQCALRG
eukprot:scaffold114650_cov49-Phaeocystis_antarctica.AAC.1